MLKRWMDRPASVWAVTGILCLVVSIFFSGSAFGETPFGMGDPVTMSRRGVPMDPGVPGNPEESPRGRFPFQPLDRDPTEGFRHGFVQTSSGRFGFETVDLRLPARVPLIVGRVYDAGIMTALPGMTINGEFRLAQDLGPNWLLKPASVLIPVPAGFTLLTDQGGAVNYVLDAGTGKYYPSPNRSQEYSVLEPDGQGGYQMFLSNGMVRFYQQVTMANNFWLVREQDPSGNGLVFTYDQGYLKRIDATDGSWVLIHRKMFGDSAPPGLPQARIVQITDSAGRSLSFTYDSEFKLATFTDAGGGVWTNAWDTNNHITQHIDPLNRAVFEVTTDANHRATAVAVGGVGVTYGYQTGQTLVTDGRGNTWTYEFNTGG